MQSQQKYLGHAKCYLASNIILIDYQYHKTICFNLSTVIRTLPKRLYESTLCKRNPSMIVLTYIYIKRFARYDILTRSKLFRNPLIFIWGPIVCWVECGTYSIHLQLLREKFEQKFFFLYFCIMIFCTNIYRKKKYGV